MLRIALVGNPNSGKTTLFNYLTGATAKFGNWPGVTVERKEGKYRTTYLNENKEALIVDLPGIYSLTPNTAEEVVSRDYILEEKPDLLINIVDITNLERNLYLTTQLLEIDVPIVVALNMSDMAKEAGIEVDADALTKKLGVLCLPISAATGMGIDKLMQRSFAIAKHPRVGKTVLADDNEFNNLFMEVQPLVVGDEKTTSPVFQTIKLMEGDELTLKKYPEQATQVTTLVKEKVPEETDVSEKITELRYNYIRKQLPTIQKTSFARTKTDKLDKVLTNRWIGIPIFLIVMLLVFHLVFSEDLFYIGALFIPEGSFDIPIIGTDAINSPGVMVASVFEWLDGLIAGGLDSLTSSWAPWLNALIVDGLWAGIGTVITFIPQILVLFFFMAILEDTGYMARVAFIFDRSLRRFGLSGQSFVPLLTGFGCTVPAIMATRTLESEKEKRITIMLSPYFSCGAKLPIWAAFASVLYGGAYQELVVFGVYLFGIVVALITAIFLKRFVMGGETQGFVMELPLYRRPTARNLRNVLTNKLQRYIKSVATILSISVIVIWFFSTFSFRFTMVSDVGDSMLGQIGKVASTIFIPLGWGAGETGWMFTVASVAGLLAKENVPAVLGTFGGVSGTQLIGSLSVPAAFSFMAFNLLTVPCMTAVAAARGELNNKRHFWGTLAFWLVNSYVVSALVYWGGVYLWLLPIYAVVIIGAILIMYVPLWRKQKYTSATT